MSTPPQSPTHSARTLKCAWRCQAMVRLNKLTTVDQVVAATGLQARVSGVKARSAQHRIAAHLALTTPPAVLDRAVMETYNRPMVLED
jgi:hypothetical protein